MHSYDEGKTWREMITAAMKRHGDTFSEVISMVSSGGDEWLDKPFDAGYGHINGCVFTVWTKTRVYFPAVYDGSEWVTSVARNPNGVPTAHVGNYKEKK